jgi:hypothetical protein
MVCPTDFASAGDPWPQLAKATADANQSAVRRGIYVEPQPQTSPAPSGRHKMSLLNGAFESIIGTLYKYAAPTALGQAKHPIAVAF